MRFLWGEDREEGGLGRAGPWGVLLAGGPRKEAADTEGPRLHFVPLAALNTGRFSAPTPCKQGSRPRPAVSGALGPTRLPKALRTSLLHLKDQRWSTWHRTTTTRANERRLRPPQPSLEGPRPLQGGHAHSRATTPRTQGPCHSAAHLTPAAGCASLSRDPIPLVRLRGPQPRPQPRRAPRAHPVVMSSSSVTVLPMRSLSLM